jgi:calmodulin
MRSLGSNPTEEELGKIIANVNATKGGVLDFPAFLEIMTQRKSDVDTELEIQEALKVFDKEGSGLLPVAELKHILTNIGERMTDDEVDEMLRDATIDAEGQIKIAQLVKLMFA